MAKWYQLLKFPSITFILGPPGSGKSVTGASILEDVAQNTELIPILAPLEDVTSLVPPEIKLIDPLYSDPEDYPRDSVVVMEDAHFLLRAERHQRDIAIEFDDYFSVHRHKDISWIIVTQLASTILKKVRRREDNLIIKAPTRRSIIN